MSAIAAGSAAFVGSAIVAPGTASATPPSCTDQWKTAASGNWDTASDWSTGNVPGASDVACITVPGTYTVTYEPAASTETVDALVLGSGTASDAEQLDLVGTCSDNVTLVTKNTLTSTDTDLINSTGHLSLTSANGCGNAATLAVGSSILNSGLITMDNGAGDGGRTITGDVTNKGTVNVNVSGAFSGGTWDNAGALTIADGQTFTVATSPSTFTDDTGGSVTSNGTNATGQLVVDAGDTYNQGNGTTAGEPVLLAGPNTGSGIALHYTGTGASNILAEGTTGTLDGNIAAGQVLSIDGTCSNDADETVDASETNSGTVHLSSTGGCGNPATLAVSTGHTFTNNSAGVVDLDNGAGNQGRTITGTFTNKGTVNVNVSGTYSGGTWTNAGTLALATGTTLNAPASAAVTFTNTTGGKVASTGTGLLELGGADTFNQGAGKLTGTEPVLLTGPNSGTTGGTKLHYTGTGTGTITTEGLGTLDGTISTGQVLDIDGTCSDNANEIIDEPMVSTGTIDLSSTGGCGNPATLAGKAAAGTDSLTVGSGGVLQTDNGAGNGGRTIHDDVILKKGVFNVNVSTTYTADKKGLTNKKGTINLASGAILNDSSVAGSFFNNKKGAIAGAGELTVQSPDTFNEGGGSITGATVLVNGANVEYTGTTHGAGTIETEGTTALTAGAPSAGQTLEVLGTCSLNGVLSTPGSITDNGALVLSSFGGCGNPSEVLLPIGDTLTIGTTGSLTWPAGSGGSKAVTGSVINDGTIGNSGESAFNISGSLTLGSSGTYEPDVSGTSSDTVTVAGSATIGGTLDPSGSFTANNVFTIVSAASTSGHFSATNGWTAVVNPTNVTMSHS